MNEKKILIDTNILVYAHDSSEIEKHPKAIKVMERLWEKKTNNAVSLQNLAEFFFVVTKKIQNKVEVKKAKEIVQDIIDLETIEKVRYKESTLQKAMTMIEERKTDDFWDALLAATMMENGIESIYTENTKDFEKIEEITAINPFLID